MVQTFPGMETVRISAPCANWVWARHSGFQAIRLTPLPIRITLKKPTLLPSQQKETNMDMLHVTLLLSVLAFAQEPGAKQDSPLALVEKGVKAAGGLDKLKQPG